MKEKLKRIRGILAILLLMVLSANSHLLMSVATGDYLQDKHVNAKSIMGMMTLTLENGRTLTVSADGIDEEAACERIREFLTKAVPQ